MGKITALDTAIEALHKTTRDRETLDWKLWTRMPDGSSVIWDKQGFSGVTVMRSSESNAEAGTQRAEDDLKRKLL